MSASNTFLKTLEKGGGSGRGREREGKTETENVHNRVKTLKHIPVQLYILGSLKLDSNFTILNTGIYGKNGYFLLVNANTFCFSN